MARDAFFYVTDNVSPLKILPNILEKIIDVGWFAHVIIQDETTLQEVDQYLWVYKDASFLPHKQMGPTSAVEEMTPVVMGSPSAFEDSLHESATHARDVVLYLEKPPQTLHTTMAKQRFIFLLARWDADWLAFLRTIQQNLGLQTHCWRLNAQGIWSLEKIDQRLEQFLLEEVGE